MDRTGTIRRLLIISGVCVWVFLLLSLGSFDPNDSPSHQVYPHPAHVHNLCGRAGAIIAYGGFFVLGQGVFPIVFFSGICLALLFFQNRISDLWLRMIGLLLLSVAFAAAIHLIKPGSQNSLPEGYGGIIGIGASSFLRQHFNTVGTGLVLVLSFFVGLLLAADDLVIRGGSMVGTAVQTIKTRSPEMRIHFRFPSLPKLPWLPGFRTRSAEAPQGAAQQGEHDELESGANITLLKNKRNLEERALDGPDRLPDSGTIDLDYDEVGHRPVAATETAYNDESDPAPSAHAVIPPPELQIVTPLQIKSAANALAANASQPADANAPNGDAKPIAPVMVDISATDPANTEAAAATEAAPVDAAASADIPVEPKKDIIVRLPNQIKPRHVAPPPPKELGEYNLPGWDFLAEAEHGFAESQEAYVREKAAVLEQALREFNIDARVVEIDTGPVITMYEISLAPGIKVSAITALSNDIARALMAVSVRIVAPVPGKNTVGIEVPNPVKEKVRLKELMQLAPEAMRKMMMPLFLGKDASGEPLIADLAAMPHCLIAGTTGSGKSVCINTIIMSMLYLQRPDYVKLILVDPKVVEMAPFKDIPHLMCPIINDAGRATSVLEWACEKMDERYEILAEAGVRNIAGFNKLSREEIIERFKPSSPEEEARIPKHLPYVVIIVDELADLMMTSGKEVEGHIVRLAQKSRAVGIHLILATQRPQATVVTGLIKSNMPSRIAFRVQSKMDSRIVLDQNGADLLLGQGDMLFMPPGASKPIRAQGTFIDDKEMRESVRLVSELAEAQYEPELVQIKAKTNAAGEIEKDDLFDDAVRVVLETKRGSVSLLQRRLTIGYGRASRLIEMMAGCGILGEYKGSQAREVAITLEEWEQMKAQQHTDAESGMTV